ncbi:integrase [Bacillus pseudomycoides]|uniref:integrase n=1 Tax=Bacillus pseudomycoides TaxID=64104 RepID=UPI000BED22E1|nr:integrase [Bacillus pseudomycoides]PDY45522.1 integrase [Bacillus pseudomycoides]PHB44757.1 integrase [Bacillus pseudomycoides]
MLNKTKFLDKDSYINLISIKPTRFHNSKENIETFLQNFNKWKTANIIENESFHDTKWFIRDKDYNRRGILFDIELYSTLNIALKCYTIHLIDQLFSVNHIHNVIRAIKESIHMSKAFNVNHLIDLEEYISKQNYRKRYELAKYTIDFFSFIDITNSDKFIDICSPFINNIKKSRDLPNYLHILYFDEKIEQFLTEGTEFELQKYFPVVLWWKITTVIPMRPTEFLKLKKNCVNQSKNNTNKYEITLPRNKEKGNLLKDIDITDTLQINKNIYDLVQIFKSFLPKEDNSQYLFTYKYYEMYKEHFGSERTRHTEFLPLRQFDSLIDQFYREILKKKYNYDQIEQISPGDTRHLAFCNMMLQGFNMLTIAIIGGHKRLETQKGYWSHLTYFTESWVYNLTEKHRRLMHVNTSLPDSSFSQYTRDTINKYKLYKDAYDTKNFLPVDFGHCTDIEYPFNCTGDCRHCSHYLFSPETDKTDEGLTWLNDYSKLLKRKINEQVSMLTFLSKNMNYNLEELNYSLIDQENLSSSANELNRLLNQKAIVDAKLPKTIE